MQELATTHKECPALSAAKEQTSAKACSVNVCEALFLLTSACPCFVLSRHAPHVPSPPPLILTSSSSSDLLGGGPGRLRGRPERDPVREPLRLRTAHPGVVRRHRPVGPVAEPHVRH